jgi:predicted nucleotide-binding protein
VPERYRAFVIHGTNHALRSEVVAILRDVGVDPVVLEDVPDDPQETIIEKFTRVFRQESCDLAIAILSPDDLTASAAAKGRGAKGRARQNAVFEVGYAYAMLGRANTLLLVPNDEEGLAPEMWSDISGVLYYRMDGAGNWRNALRAFIERRKERGMWPFAR